ncbi:MAG TPA: hypothetical protein PKX93_08270, partial [bacterium]|nr:hypothetical protein [bacterium]
MKRKLWLLPLFFLALTGCETMVKETDLATFKEEVAQNLQHLDSKVEDLRDELNRKTENQSKSAAEDRAALSEGLENLTKQVRELTGKISDLDYQLREALNKNITEQENKNLEFRREIEALK